MKNLLVKIITKFKKIGIYFFDKHFNSVCFIFFIIMVICYALVRNKYNIVRKEELDVFDHILLFFGFQPTIREGGINWGAVGRAITNTANQVKTAVVDTAGDARRAAEAAAAETRRVAEAAAAEARRVAEAAARELEKQAKSVDGIKGGISSTENVFKSIPQEFNSIGKKIDGVSNNALEKIKEIDNVSAGMKNDMNNVNNFFKSVPGKFDNLKVTIKI